MVSFGLHRFFYTTSRYSTFGEIADGILARGMHAAEFPLLSVGQFGLLAAQFPPGAGDGHALAGAHADEIGFELGDGGEDIEEHLSHGIVRVVEGPYRGPVKGGVKPDHRGGA